MDASEKRIEDARLLSMYKEGFSHISSAVDRVEFLWPQTADLLVGAYCEVNTRLLEQIRDERDELEAEVKRFLAKANSKLVYLSNLEKHLSQLQQEMHSLYEEAKTDEPSEAAVSEGGERS